MENLDLLENSEILIHSPVHLYSRTNTVLSTKQTQKPVFKRDESITSLLKFGQESFKSVVQAQNTVTFLPRLIKKTSNRPPLRDLLDNGVQPPNQWYINGQFYNRDGLKSYIKAENYQKRLLFASDQSNEAFTRQRFLYNRFKSQKSSYIQQKYPTNTTNSKSLPSLIINFKVK